VVTAPRELDVARDDLRRAVTLDPTFAEGHLHLGHVLGEQGSHADAVRELGAAVATIEGVELQYDACMLLGREQEAGGDRSSARTNFERAATLFPHAQSPRLAVSELLHSEDAHAAQAPIEALLALPGDEISRVDPWWTYSRSHVRNAAAKLDDVWREVRAEASK
jgi:hypothetical protein